MIMQGEGEEGIRDKFGHARHFLLIRGRQVTEALAQHANKERDLHARTCSRGVSLEWVMRPDVTSVFRDDNIDLVL